MLAPSGSSHEDDHDSDPLQLDVVPMTEAFARMMTGQKPDPRMASSAPYQWKPRLSKSMTRKAVKQEVAEASNAFTPRPTPRKRDADMAVEQPSAAGSSADIEQPVLKTPRGTRSSQ